MINYVTIKKFCENTGYSENAIRAMIKRGEWLEDKHYKRPTPRRILLKLDAIKSWIEK